MFVNYFADDSRSTPLNLAVARIVLGTYVGWRVASLEWGFYSEWPWALRNAGAFLHGDLLLSALPYLQWVILALLALFVLGYRIPWTGGLAGLLLLHVLSVKSSIYLAGTVESLFVCGYFLLLFAFFPRDDRLSADGLAATRRRSLSELNAFLQEGGEDAYRTRPLKWGLLAVGILYFGAAWGKLREGSYEILLSGADLQRVLVRAQELHGVQRPVAQFIAGSPEVAWVGYVGTVAIQLALLVVVVLGLTTTPVVVGLLGFHLLVMATIGLYFIDMMLVLLLFLAWDRGYRLLARDASDGVDIVYDGDCRLCARSLFPFKHLDVNGSVDFYPLDDAPPEHADRVDADLEDGVYVFRDGEAHAGYWAYRELLRQFTVFAPAVWLMNRSPVAAFGERVYERVAADRSRAVATTDAD